MTKSTVSEIAKDIFRISTFNPDFGMQVNQFLIKDDEPFLMHTSFKSMFPDSLEGIASVIDPATLRWIGFSHFESDECGALNEFLKVAPHAQAACSFVGAMVNVNDFAVREARPLSDGEILDTGHHRIRFLSTPHVPHCWDAGLFFDETTRTLLCSDLFFHPGDPKPLAGLDLLDPARETLIANKQGPFAKDLPYTPYTESTFMRLAELNPAAIGLMHGSSFSGNGRAAIVELSRIIKENLAHQE
jgi:flavorubredoxin